MLERNQAILIVLVICTILCPVFSVTQSSIIKENTTVPALDYNPNNDAMLGCNRTCGCDRAYFYNETTNQCDLDLEYIINMVMRQSTKDRSIDTKNEDHDMANDKGIAKTIFVEAETVFRSIIISALLFMACATVCVLSASIYCCHIKRSDRKMDRDIKALAQKLNRKYQSNKSMRKTPLEPIEESCNVVVEDAGIFVV